MPDNIKLDQVFADNAKLKPEVTEFLDKICHGHRDFMGLLKDDNSFRMCGGRTRKGMREHILWHFLAVAFQNERPWNRADINQDVIDLEERGYIVSTEIDGGRIAPTDKLINALKAYAPEFADIIKDYPETDQSADKPTFSYLAV